MFSLIIKKNLRNTINFGLIALSLYLIFFKKNLKKNLSTLKKDFKNEKTKFNSLRVTRLLVVGMVIKMFKYDTLKLQSNSVITNSSGPEFVIIGVPYYRVSLKPG